MRSHDKRVLRYLLNYNHFKVIVQPETLLELGVDKKGELYRRNIFDLESLWVHARRVKIEEGADVKDTYRSVTNKAFLIGDITLKNMNGDTIHYLRDGYMIINESDYQEMRHNPDLKSLMELYYAEA